MAALRWNDIGGCHPEHVEGWCGGPTHHGFDKLTMTPFFNYVMGNVVKHPAYAIQTGKADLRTSDPSLRSG
jgi:hypothetical protein